MSLSNAPSGTLSAFFREHFVAPVARAAFKLFGTKTNAASYDDFFITATEPLTLANAHPLMFDLLRQDPMHDNDRAAFLVSGILAVTPNKIQKKSFVFSYAAVQSLGLPFDPAHAEPSRLLHPKPLAVFTVGPALEPWIKIYPRAYMVRELRYSKAPPAPFVA